MTDPTTVLLVGDDPILAERLAPAIERAGTELGVELAGRADEALDRLAEGDVDGVIADHGLAGSDGLELLRAVRRVHGDLPFVLLVDERDGELLREAVDAGVTDCRTKDADPIADDLLAARIRDAVERRRRAARERDQRDRYRGLFERLRDPVLVMGPDGRIEDCNPAFVDRFGYTKAEIAGEDTGVLLEDGSVEAFDRGLQEHGSGFTEEFEFLTKAGEAFLGLATVYRQRDGDAVATFVVLIRDLSERRRLDRRRALTTGVSREIAAADSLQEGLELALREITAYTEWCYAEAWVPDRERGVLVFDTGHAAAGELQPFLEASRGVTFRFGDGLPGRVYADRAEEWQPDVSALPADDFHRQDIAAEYGSRAAFGLPLTAEGEVFAVLVFYLRERRKVDERLIHDVSNVVASLGGLAAKKRAEDLRRRQNERLDEFAAVVSHDLRNPLSVARGRLELARESAADGHGDLDTAARALERMEALIEDLLALARAGGESGEWQPVTLGDLVRETADVVEVDPDRLRIGSERRVFADPSRLRQLFENLLRNAVEHGGKDVTVTVGDLADGFYVEDDGPGVPADRRDAVFETSYTSAEIGSGLGLNIVRRIAEKHGWGVALTAGEAGGARFEFSGVEAA